MFNRQYLIFALTFVCLFACTPPETGAVLGEGGTGKPGAGGTTGGGACAAYDAIDDASIVFYLHELVQTAYRPILVELDQGGNPNRYTYARRLMFTEVER